MLEKHVHVNRLINQKSPYLLQHAHNPVDWYPWSQEAFEESVKQDKPIFLSIGYATCHWCHVMEKESFEDPVVAQAMNKAFINIKVDREELPEIDSLYMEFAQSIMGGTAGWPLNLVLTPRLIPFFAATYLPPHNAHGLMGMVEMIGHIDEVWKGEGKETIVAQSEKILDLFNRSIHVKGSELPDAESVDKAADFLFKMTDPVFGGIKGAPKFPIGYQYVFFLHFYHLRKDGRALFVVEKTLDMMHRGGIYDHLGGGFSRYSVDERWGIPHFEKMLYDNALLAQAYLEAWQVTKKKLYGSVCKEVLDYVLRDMTHPQGAFYSAEDADSEGREGFFYTWPYEEVVSTLGESASLFCEFYDISQEGDFDGRNVLNTPVDINAFAERKGLGVQELEVLFSTQRKKLWEKREKRPRPFKDDKVLSSWNGLMIAALAVAGKTFVEKKYTVAALKAATFIENEMTCGGRLFRRWRDGEARHNAGLDEYAYLIKGYLALFETGLGAHWLDRSIRYADILKTEFKAKDGAFYQTDGQDCHVIMRKCQFSDGSEPSGNAVHAENLLKLYQMTGRSEFLRQAEDIFMALKKYIDDHPQGYSYHMMNLLRYYDKQAPLLVVVMGKNGASREEMEGLLFQTSIPHKSVIWANPEDPILFELMPELTVYQPLEGRTTLYICFQKKCKQPINDFLNMQQAIHRM